MRNIKLKHILNCHPIIKTDIIEGKNTILLSDDGKKIIDFEAGIWCTALGHSNSKINSIIVKQIDKIMHSHYKLTCNISDNLAMNLLKLLQFQDGKAVFLSSGSEAVELSMRISKLVSNKKKVLTFSTSYLSAYSSTSFPRDNNLWTEVDFLKCSNCSNKKCTNYCSLLRNINFTNISTFILEPGNSGGRVLLPPYNLVDFLSNEVKKHGGLIVANEVTTGFGRTGEWFGFNHYNLKPDIVALGKCLGNGYPISGVVMKKEIANQIEEQNFHYAQSHQNDPLGCKIANEVISIIKENNLIARSKNIGEFFLNQLIKLQNSCEIIKDVRGRGLMLAVELKIKDSTEIICEKMLEKGFFIGTTPASNILRFYPALTISKKDILNMCMALEHVLKEVIMR
ncbi:class-III pyridoxal-phosphate-dependent aminotransferase [Maledivibacter halophilus]|uniref:Acetylornithine aminotransferase n=1 Tax=Maledivibacter halophilus TaxID=36842 RepID=A0A1T5MTH0_9FIRM|nr:aspartate aminotransferase family protein [Maledivibacter halophilus]SKC91530.1 acetylornithine aminotransferase [Maledivibacter halophilus]